MLSYCLKCRKNTECKKPKSCEDEEQKIMLLLNCAVFDKRKIYQKARI